MVAAAVTEATKDAVPRGFKQTEIGLIPEDWEVVALSNVAANSANAIVGGPFGSDLVSKDYVATGVPVIRGQNMRYPDIGGDWAFVGVSKADKLKVNTAKPRDLIFTQRGTLGQVSLVPIRPFKKYIVSQSQMKITLNFERAYPEFLLQYFSSENGHAQIIDSAIQTGVPHTNLGILRQYLIPLPPLPEQEAIAGALSDADGAIRAVERALAKQRAVKQAALHALLTPTTRLPGFSGDWETKTLGELGTFLKGSGVRKDEAQSGSIPCVRYGELYTDHHDVIRAFRSRISSGVASKATRLRYGDILFAGSGETKEEIGKSVAFAEKIEAFAGGDIVILRIHDAEPVFLGYALNMPAIQRQKASKGQGDAVVHISSAALAAIEISLPPLPEQRAIAAVLSDMDAAIAALEARRDKLKAVKQGMMQTLLTGKVRLV